jgi:hypothetical protein
VSTRRVDETLSASRNSVATRSSDGKTAKSSGRLICMATSRISSDAVMFRPSSRSSTAAGIGTTSMRTIATTPMGTAALPSPFTRVLAARWTDAGSRGTHRQPACGAVPVEIGDLARL